MVPRVSKVSSNPFTILSWHSACNNSTPHPERQSATILRYPTQVVCLVEHTWPSASQFLFGWEGLSDSLDTFILLSTFWVVFKRHAIVWEEHGRGDVLRALETSSLHPLIFLSLRIPPPWRESYKQPQVYGEKRDDSWRVLNTDWSTQAAPYMLLLLFPSPYMALSFPLILSLLHPLSSLRPAFGSWPLSVMSMFTVDTPILTQTLKNNLSCAWIFIFSPLKIVFPLKEDWLAL